MMELPSYYEQKVDNSRCGYWIFFTTTISGVIMIICGIVSLVLLDDLADLCIVGAGVAFISLSFFLGSMVRGCCFYG